MQAILAEPRGFCAGVVRAIDIVERALELYGPPVYVLHEIVHNPHVVDDLRSRGAIFVETVDEIPPGARAIFSAHGVADSVVEAAAARGLRSIDATCPLVTKVHGQAQRYANQDYDVVIVGHAGHPEVEGTRGSVRGRVHVVGEPAEVDTLVVADPARVAYVTQTTLSMDDTRDVIDALKARFPAARGPDTNDICYATQNRQNAVKALLADIDVLLVVGAHNSSNSNRLREVGERAGKAAYLLGDAADLDPAWFGPDTRIGITAGASTPQRLVDAVIERLKGLGLDAIDTQVGVAEEAIFRLPPELARPGRGRLPADLR
ncbi:MAG: 4-hydroxy-3-methylbut-2-enyl diphosphate reductase [Immundisolibacter sp.]|uniref:4-hydroxy-3-methylbut-2-enyl diphosphate reductase n=1 Tax=Immundisolibacter sp. TaxID=1934948 RepID=UPI00199BF248|nr:4-hydroxy-3-methylbut-2-enyl diphosphate reductase [Immundisolibacter sp.]MBC7162098.1 4-hydroxy-3-methylbut-2-enyl diphosphate reductase [Immundisolibacter sp.]